LFFPSCTCFQVAAIAEGEMVVVIVVIMLCNVMNVVFLIDKASTSKSKYELV